jgi:hypothetical protein
MKKQIMQTLAVGQLLPMCSDRSPPGMTNGRFLALAFVESQDLIANNQPHADFNCRVENAPDKKLICPPMTLEKVRLRCPAMFGVRRPAPPPASTPSRSPTALLRFDPSAKW